MGSGFILEDLQGFRSRLPSGLAGQDSSFREICRAPSVVATIYNVTGQQVVSHKISTENQTLNISHLVSGMYLVQLYFKDTNISKSFKKIITHSGYLDVKALTITI